MNQQTNTEAESDLIRACLSAGIEGDSDQELIANGFSTGVLATAIAEAADVKLRLGYDSIQPEQSLAQAVGVVESASTFREKHLVGFDIDHLPSETGPAGEINSTSFATVDRPVACGIYGQKLSLTRQQIRRGDLDMLGAAATALGYNARLKLEQSVATTLQALTFDTVNSTSAGSLDADSLNTGIALLRGVTHGSDSIPVLYSPRWLLVPVALEGQARSLVGSATSNYPDIRLLTSPFLTGSYVYLVHKSETHGPLSISYLDGRDRPSVNVAESDFRYLGSQVVATFSYGVAERDRDSVCRIQITG